MNNTITPYMTVLVVEDDVLLNKTIRKMLDREGFVSEEFFTGNAVMERIRTSSNDVLMLLDYSLPDLTAMELIEKIRTGSLDVPFIIVTGHGDEQLAVDMMKLGALDYIVKSLQFHDVLPAKIKRACNELTGKRNLALAETALKESEERYRTLFDEAKDGIALADADSGRLIECNNALCRMVGRSKTELTGQLQSILHVPKHLAIDKSTSFVSHLAGDSGMVLDDELLSKNGKTIPVEIKASKVRMSGQDYLLGIFRDVSDRKHLEKEKERLNSQLIQAQKLEAVGTLAGGVAHDFNNLLTGITGFIDLAMLKLDVNDPACRDLKQATVAALRAGKVVRQLLLFSRKQPMESVTFNLNGVILNLIKMLQRLISEDVAIVTELAPDLWAVQGDEGNMEQVIMNMVVNARDAMPLGGNVTIVTKNASVDAEYCQNKSFARPGKFILLSITDTGTGMDTATMEHIFEPFYTTKEKGKGTGLGLSVVFSIVKQHDGWIEVESMPGHGTNFQIYLPSSNKKIDCTTTELFRREDYRGAGERILLIEDQYIVREFALEVLRENGYTVFTAGNAKEARALFASEKEHFDLVFSDIVLSDMSGIQLFGELSSGRELRVLFSSGYTDNKAESQIIKEKKYRFLPKPYAMESLLRAVRDTLEDKP